MKKLFLVRQQYPPKFPKKRTQIGNYGKTRNSKNMISNIHKKDYKDKKSIYLE